MRPTLFLTALTCFWLISPAAAQDGASVKNGPLEKWINAENALIDPLSKEGKESFFIIRNKYSIIRVTRVVERDIGAAVKSCGDKNPDIKNSMESRFNQWKNAVNPILDTAQKTLDKDLQEQKIVDVKAAKNVLKLNDEAYEHGEKQIVKTPVITKEACGELLRSMDETENQMVELLQQTLLPESVIRQRSAEMDEAKKSAVKEAPKAE